MTTTSMTTSKQSSGSVIKKTALDRSKSGIDRSKSGIKRPSMASYWTKRIKKARKAMDSKQNAQQLNSMSGGLEMDLDVAQVLLWSRSKQVKKSKLICGEIEVFEGSHEIAIAKTNEPYWQIRVDTEANDLKHLENMVFCGIMGFKGYTAVLPFIAAYPYLRYKRLGRAVMDIQTISEQEILKLGGCKSRAFLGRNPVEEYPGLADFMSVDGSEIVFRVFKVIRPIMIAFNEKDALAEAMIGDRLLANLATAEEMGIASALSTVHEVAVIDLHSLSEIGQFLF